ncbi:flagellin N-terminal-like domain-containing protein [Halomicrobium zhouii]|uniref:Flagellin N-terminal-like domain-containing protein n=1 Tax=Halomicrobium zhouii TaxID=767519 RepID=A0A1I6L967_9EURY|nr:type IV pilin N-terminal domain-containing protein [Halomicrobium zhouii]SFR99977.1 flagellin N-terminal-like domain-containing protein [Halomicrobium zhouii]
MDLKQLINDDDAVSPVIGVILMVAITVILAAVIASFVLGLGDQTSNTTPQASFSFDYEQGTSPSGSFISIGSGNTLEIVHDGGDTIDSERLSVSDGTNSADFDDPDALGASAAMSAGNSVTVEIENDDVVRVIYSGESGDSSSTLATYEAPGA